MGVEKEESEEQGVGTQEAFLGRRCRMLLKLRAILMPLPFLGTRASRSWAAGIQFSGHRQRKAGSHTLTR
jgi:hypothetical protein